MTKSNSVNERIYNRLLILAPNLWALENGAALNSTVPGFMKLNLDILEKDGQYLIIALSHYYKHSGGDMIADPDMEIQIFSTGVAEALAYQDIFGYQRIDTGRVNLRLKKGLNAFLDSWLKNCIIQGHRLK